METWDAALNQYIGFLIGSFIIGYVMGLLIYTVKRATDFI